MGEKTTRIKVFGYFFAVLAVIMVGFAAVQNWSSDDLVIAGVFALLSAAMFTGTRQRQSGS